MGDVEARAAEVLAAHEHMYPDSVCACGHLMAESWKEYHAHIAAALAEAGLLAPDPGWDGALDAAVAERDAARAELAEVKAELAEWRETKRELVRQALEVEAREAALREGVRALAEEMGSAYTFEQWDDLCVRLSVLLTEDGA